MTHSSSDTYINPTSPSLLAWGKARNHVESAAALLKPKPHDRLRNTDSRLTPRSAASTNGMPDWRHAADIAGKTHSTIISKGSCTIPPHCLSYEDRSAWADPQEISFGDPKYDRSSRDRYLQLNAAVLLKITSLGFQPLDLQKQHLCPLPNGSGGRCCFVDPLVRVEEAARFAASSFL